MTAWRGSTKGNPQKQMIIKHLWKYKSPKDQSCIFILQLFRSLALTIIPITMVQCFEFQSNKNVSNRSHINGHNTNAPPLTFHMNYSSMEPVLFEKLPNIKLFRSIFRVTMLFQFGSTKSSLNILLQYTQCLAANIHTLYTKLITNNDDQKTYNAPQQNLTYTSLLTSYSQEVNNCKCQTIELYTQLHNMFKTIDQSKHICTKCGIIHSVFNFLFGTPSSAKEINPIKNNMEILKENQDTLSNQFN